PLLELDQRLIGNKDTYAVTKKLCEYIWLARSKSDQIFLIKCAPYPQYRRIDHERRTIKKFQSQTTCLRPLLDRIKEPVDPPAIVLKYLDDDLLKASAAKWLTIPEIKYVSKKILEGLSVLHDAGYVHTDIKLNNVLVNYGLESRFTDVQISDLESASHIESQFCKSRPFIGTPIWRSPEAALGLQWGTPTDIWSFSTMLISIIWGNNFFIFNPGVSCFDEAYGVIILTKFHIYFGPFPPPYADLLDERASKMLSWIQDTITSTAMRPLLRASRREISEEDRRFDLKVMTLDPRDRPTARQLLSDEWFHGV
ncbi:serine/threonine protein kinase, partial [Aspergillus sclerotioniger CBS 115572]